MTELDTIIATLEQRGERAIPAPPAPASFSVHIGEHEEGGTFEAGNEVLDVVGLALGITYVDSRGEESRRRITVRSLSERHGVLMLNAYCHERDAVRQFRVDRIEEIAVLSTGEIIEDAAEFFASLSGRDHTAEVIAGCRHALQVLTFLARCDGHLHPAEQDQIVEFVINTGLRPLEVDEQRVRQHVSALYPDKTTYLQSLRAIRFCGGEQMRQLSRAIRKVLDDDGVLDGREFEWALEAQAELPKCER